MTICVKMQNGRGFSLPIGFTIIIINKNYACLYYGMHEKLYAMYFFFHFREVSELIISIIQARDLSPNQYSGTLDTYIRGILQPKSDAKFQTKVKLECLTSHYILFSLVSYLIILHKILQQQKSSF